MEVREDRQWNAELTDWHYEIKPYGNRLILHLWTADRSLTRKVISKTEETASRLVLRVERIGRGPGRLEFVLPTTLKSGLQQERQRFLNRFQSALAVWFPDEEVVSLSVARDLEHSFSGSYVRGTVVARGQVQVWAVLAASATESAATIDSILTHGIIWLDWARKQALGKSVAGLRLFLPGGTSQTTVHRLQGMHPSTRIQVFEIDESLNAALPIDTQDVGNVETRLTPRHEIERMIEKAALAAREIKQLAPEAIDIVPLPGPDHAALRLYGLEFARWNGVEIQVSPSLSPRGKKSDSSRSIDEVVRELDRYRNPAAKNPNHPWYRSQPERWLETMILSEPSRIDPRLDPRQIYSQVPAYAAADRSVIDLLGVRRDGRLVIIEVKASEDIHLVVQAIDYWARVRWHQQREELQRFGYFAGVQLQGKPPLLYLVAPSLQFHPATEILLRYVSADIEVQRVGLNEDWRRGLRVVFRQ